jgi:hypothetical protein
LLLLLELLLLLVHSIWRLDWLFVVLSVSSPSLDLMLLVELPWLSFFLIVGVTALVDIGVSIIVITE